MSLRCILVSSLIGFTIISLGLLIGYFLDPRPLSVYEDMALFAFLIKQWYIIPCAVCFGFLFCKLQPMGLALDKVEFNTSKKVTKARLEIRQNAFWLRERVLVLE